MRSFRMMLSLAILAVALCAAPGCDILGFKSLTASKVYLKPGYGAEIAKPAKIYVYVKDEKTGERVLGVVEAWPGYVVARDTPASEVAADPVKSSADADEAPQPSERCVPSEVGESPPLRIVGR